MKPCVFACGMRSLRQGQRKSHRTVDQQCQVLDVEEQIRVRARRACKKQIRKTCITGATDAVDGHTVVGDQNERDSRGTLHGV